MSAIPGWYPLPNEEGMMDYWDGQAWAGSKCPVPSVTPAPTGDPLNVPAPTASPLPLGLPGSSSNSPNAWTPEKIIEQVKEVASDKRNQATGMQAGGGALIADGIVGFGEKRAGIFGALSTILFGIVWLVVSNFIFGGQGIKDYEAETTGTVVSMTTETSRDSDGDVTTYCVPNAEFNVDGKQYTATPSEKIMLSPCPWHISEKVDVYYDKLNPVNARISTENETKMFRILFMGTGILVLLAGVGTFIKRALSIGAGIWLWRKGTAKKASMKQ